MRVVFVYTDVNSPSASTARNIVKIEEVTENNVDKIKCTNASGTAFTFNKSQGQIAILWE